MGKLERMRMLRLGSRVSGSRTCTTAKHATPRAVTIINIACQPNAAVTYAPANGARIGAIPITKIRKLNTCADACGVYKSRTIARAITKPAHEPMACKNRSTIKLSKLGAKAQATEVTTYNTKPKYNGGLRPKRSDAVPYSSWPINSPRKNDVSDSSTRFDSVEKLCAMSPKAGKYMSMDSGPNAVNSASTTTTRSNRALSDT